MNDDVNIFELYKENTSKTADGGKVRAIVDEHGNKRWYDEYNRIHREDGPAVEYACGEKYWMKHGKLHRIGAPAIEYADGSTEWFYNGRIHRVDGPAGEYSDGSKSWYVSGVIYTDINKWAAAALMYEGKEPTKEMIEQKIQSVMQQDLFS